MRRFRRFRPSGSMLVATLALVMATTGSAVAASLITSKQIKNGTIQTKDISKKARKALKGQRGLQGLQGVQGVQGVKGDKGDRGDPGAIAYGFIFSNGTVSRATPNVTSTWNAAQSWYEITITGHTYLYSNYVTLITPSNATLIASAASALGKLIVLFRNTSGTLVQTPGGFQFATYAP
jgi:hypothetical protein